MQKLILIKHSLPEIVPGVPADQWQLSEEGRARCILLAELLMQYRPQALVCSHELKARQTAAILGERLSLSVEALDGLHEHLRRTAPFATTQDFEAAVARLFAHPAELVYGEETADQASLRFAQALQSALERHPDQNLLVVTHGTVISLFAANRCGLEPFALWKRSGLPSFLVISLPEFTMLEVVEMVSYEKERS